MNLISNLKTSEEFSVVSTLHEIYHEKLGMLKYADVTKRSFETFMKDTLVIVDKEKYATEDLYLKHLRVGAKAIDKTNAKNIEQLVMEHFKKAPVDHVEIKGMQSKGNQTINFNATIRMVVSDNFEILLSKIGNQGVLALFQSSIILLKHREIYVQVIGRSLQYFFERPKIAKQQANPGKKFRQELNAKNLLELSLDRNTFLYCLHSNKKVDFFHKSIFYTMKTQILARKTFLGIKSSSATQLITPDIIREFWEAIFSKNDRTNTATRQNLSEHLSMMISNYMKMNMEVIFRKCCPLNFGKYSKCKTAYSKLKFQCHQKDASYDKLQKHFAENFVTLTNMTVDELQVYRFIKKIFMDIFPVTLFGACNLKTLLHYIKKLITMKRFETFTLKEVYNKFDVKGITWFQRGFNPLFEKEIRTSKLNLITKLLYFTFTSIIYLIKANFFITEKHNEHNKLFFYSKSVWLLITRFGTLQLELENLRKVTSRAQLHPSALIERPLGKLRFVPKNDSLRPIMTFHKRFRDVKHNKLVRIASYLTPVKIVLRSVKHSLAEKCGYSVFDNHQIFAKLETFVDKWKARGMPYLYCASMDIKKCYDSVNLDKMFEFIKNDTTIKEFYLINNFFKIIRNKRFYFDEEKKGGQKKFTNLFFGKRRDNSNTIEDLSDLQTYFKDQIIHAGKTIFIDSGVKYFVTKEEIIEKLSFICNNVFVRFGKAYYQLNRGLPQGLSVSSVLSSFYYALLEYQATHKLVQEIENEDGLFLIMRLTDDYLIVSDKQRYTTKIVEQLMQCAKDNDFQFNTKKLKANFDLKNFTKETENNLFKWIGKTFYLPKFEIEHTQILDKKEAFYTVNTNLPQDEKLYPDFLKGKFKTFFLNQNTFYFNKKINSDEKILTILPKIVTSSYYKLNTYLTLLANRQITSNIKKEGFLISKKLLETVIDCSYLITAYSTNLKLRNIITLILEKIREMLEGNCDSKLKFFLLNSLKERVKLLPKMKLTMIE